MPVLVKIGTAEVDLPGLALRRVADAIGVGGGAGAVAVQKLVWPSRHIIAGGHFAPTGVGFGFQAAQEIVGIRKLIGTGTQGGALRRVFRPPHR